MSKRKFEPPDLYEILNDKLNELKTFIGNYGITIVIEREEDTHYYFKLFYGENEIAQLIAIMTYANVRTFATRSHRKLDDNYNVIDISWIKINEQYQGKSLGSFLLLYSLIYLKQKYPYVVWSILDDDSDRSTSTKNIYAFMGYEFVDFVSLINKNTLKISGPEKQLDIERDFMPNIDNLIKSVETKIDRAFTKKIGGNKKTRKNGKKRIKSVKKNGKSNKKTKKTKN